MRKHWYCVFCSAYSIGIYDICNDYVFYIGRHMSVSVNLTRYVYRRSNYRFRPVNIVKDAAYSHLAPTHHTITATFYQGLATGRM